MNRIARPSGASSLAFLPEVNTPVTRQHPCALYLHLVPGLDVIEICHCLIHGLVKIADSVLILDQSWDMGCMLSGFKAEALHHA